jgi:thymidylate synthase
MEWPLFFNENLEIGNPESSVVICTLWTQSDKIKVKAELFAIKGNLYSGNGIKYLVRNLLANPKIRYIVVCGNDRTGSGDDIVNLFREGVDGKGRIKNSKIALDPKLTSPVIDKLRNNVELIDMRGKEDDVEKRIKSLKPKPPYSKPIIIEESKQEKSAIQVDNVSGFRIEEESIAKAWLSLLDHVMKFGEEKRSEHGLKQLEALNVMSIIDGDDARIAEWLPFSEKELQKYYETFFGIGTGKGLSYTYGKRLFEYICPGSEPKWEYEAKTTFDQIKNAISHLKQAPYTRRAAAFTWYVHEDSMSESPPCLTQITWNIKYGKLFQTAVFRSHDMFGGWPMNAFALRELQKRIAKELKTEAGPLTIISNSAHIYENNFSQAREIISKHYSGQSLPYKDDKLGYFTIRLENKKITARHHLPDGHETPFVFSSEDSTGMLRKILHENLVSRLDHAAYLGKELARAEQALKSGQKYVQE